MDYFELKTTETETLGLRRNFLVLPNFLEESKLGVFLRVTIIARDEFYLNDLSIWQSKYLVTKICSSSYCSVNCPPSPLSPQPPIPFLCSEWHYTSFYLSLNLSCMWGSYMYKIKFDFLLSILHVNLILRQSRRTSWKGEENFFLPYSIMSKTLWKLWYCHFHKDVTILWQLPLPNQALTIQTTKWPPILVHKIIMYRA